MIYRDTDGKATKPFTKFIIVTRVLQIATAPDKTVETIPSIF